MITWTDLYTAAANDIHNVVSTLPLSILTWVMGYIGQRLTTTENLIRMPFWLCLLCGVPKRHTISPWPTVFQLCSIVLPFTMFITDIFFPVTWRKLAFNIFYVVYVTVMLLWMRVMNPSR